MRQRFEVVVGGKEKSYLHPQESVVRMSSERRHRTLRGIMTDPSTWMEVAEDLRARAKHLMDTAENLEMAARMEKPNRLTPEGRQKISEAAKKKWDAIRKQRERSAKGKTA